MDQASVAEKIKRAASTTSVIPAAPGVLASLSAHAATDRKVNARFDRALKKIKKEPKLKPVKLKRKPGRPKAGRAIFTQAHLDALPLYGSVSEVSRALQIKHTSLQQWTTHGPNPLKFVAQGGHKLFRRDVVIAWLKATRRFGALSKNGRVVDPAKVEAKRKLDEATRLHALAKVERESGKAGCQTRAKKFQDEAEFLENCVLKSGYEPLEL